MIDTIIFDLDGVLINSKNIHFEALNRALIENKIKYQINYEDHLKTFDGLPTSRKLEILNKKKLVTKKLNKKINQKKFNYKKTIKRKFKIRQKYICTIPKLSKKFKLGIATNAIQETLEIAIKKLRIGKFLNFSISTEKLENSKPHPEIYLRSIVNLNTKPKNTLILEDSHNGRIAAKEAGARLMQSNH